MMEHKKRVRGASAASHTARAHNNVLDEYDGNKPPFEEKQKGHRDEKKRKQRKHWSVACKLIIGGAQTSMITSHTYIAQPLEAADSDAVLRALVQQEPFLGQRVLVSGFVRVPDPVATANAMAQQQQQQGTVHAIKHASSKPSSSKNRARPASHRRQTAQEKGEEGGDDLNDSAATSKEANETAPQQLTSTKMKQRFLVVTQTHLLLYNASRLVVPTATKTKGGRLLVERTTLIPLPSVSRCECGDRKSTVVLTTAHGVVELVAADEAVASRIAGCIHSTITATASS